MLRYRSIVKRVLSVLSDVSYFIYPGQCAVCGKEVEKGHVCRECTRKILGSFSMLRFNEKVDFPLIKEEVAFSECISGWEYSNDIKNLISLMKYRGFENLCFWTGRIIGRKIKQVVPHNSIIVSVPLHAARKRERGYNQSDLIAEGIIKENPGLQKKNFLVRTRDTKPQAGLNGRERQENVRGAFKVKRTIPSGINTVIIVDDVITTGATINNFAAVL